MLALEQVAMDEQAWREVGRVLCSTDIRVCHDVEFNISYNEGFDKIAHGIELGLESLVVGARPRVETALEAGVSVSCQLKGAGQGRCVIHSVRQSPDSERIEFLVSNESSEWVDASEVRRIWIDGDEVAGSRVTHFAMHSMNSQVTPTMFKFMGDRLRGLACGESKIRHVFFKGMLNECRLLEDLNISGVKVLGGSVHLVDALPLRQLRALNLVKARLRFKSVERLREHFKEQAPVRLRFLQMQGSDIAPKRDWFLKNPALGLEIVQKILGENISIQRLTIDDDIRVHALEETNPHCIELAKRDAEIDQCDWKMAQISVEADLRREHLPKDTQHALRSVVVHRPGWKGPDDVLLPHILAFAGLQTRREVTWTPRTKPYWWW